MAGTITHSWNGTILTITSDSGTTSMDLKGSQGDIGPRGPQGAAGVSMGSGGSVDLTGYATEAYVDNAVAAVKPDVDLSNYYTRSQTDAAISTAIGNIDITDAELSNYYTKAQVNALIPDTSGFATDDDVAQAVSDKVTKTYVDSKVAGFATESFVSAKIAEAQLGGGEGGGSIDLSGYALKSDIPTHTSDLTNDSGFLTQHQSLAGYATKDELNNYLLKDGSIPMTGRLIIQSPDGLWLDDTGSNSNLYMNFDRSHSCAAIYSDGDIAFTTFDKRIIGVATPVEDTDVANKNYVDTAITNAIAALDGSEVLY